MLCRKREVVDTQCLVGQLRDDLVQMDAAPSDRVIVLLLARHLAAVAASAIFIVDHQPLAFHRSLPIYSRQSFPCERPPAHRGPGEMPWSRRGLTDRLGKSCRGWSWSALHRTRTCSGLPWG